MKWAALVTSFIGLDCLLRYCVDGLHSVEYNTYIVFFIHIIFMTFQLQCLVK